MAEFIPFRRIDHVDPVVVVDAYHPRALVYSHWKGAGPTGPLMDDTSTGIVLNAIRQQDAGLQIPYVTNHHFDIDGFLGVWSFLNQEQALNYEGLFREAALIGDFREYDPDRPFSDEALKLCCWINSVEKKLFYEPFGEQKEVEACVEKYAYFLEALPGFLANPEAYRVRWQAEYQRVKDDWESLQQDGRRELISELRLLVVRPPAPGHYYALFGASREADMVLSIYPGQRYELEYKYTTWVDTTRHQAFERVDLRPLADRLNALESQGIWEADRVRDTGPALRIQGTKLSKAERFAHPYEREIQASSLSEATLMKEIQAYYQAAYPL